MSLAHVIVYACGFLWLCVYEVPALAWIDGVQKFLLTTLVKTLLAATLVPALWNLVRALRA